MPYSLNDGGSDIDVDEADARLIAAAPDLLEGLRDILEIAASAGCAGQDINCAVCRAFNRGAAVIAKATGEAP